MATPVFGMNFGNECIAAGLGGLAFSWEPDTGTFYGRENLTDEQNATLNSVVAAHDPNTPLPDPIRDLMGQVASLQEQLAGSSSKRRKKDE